MIMTIRNQIKQSTFRYVAFFIFIVLSIGMISVPALMRQESGSSWALKVNGEKISYQHLAQETAEQSAFLAQVRAQYGQYADLLFQAMGWPTDPQALAVEELIKKTLLNQFVHQWGIRIHADYMSQSINDAQFARNHLQRILPAFVFDQAGNLDSEKLSLYLQHKGISIKEFENTIEQNLAQLQAVRLIASSCYVPSFDIQQEFIAQKAAKKFSYLTFSYDSFLAAEKKNSITPEDAQAFYQKQNTQHRRYWVPEKRDGTVWKFNPSNYNISISDEHINEYYEDNKVSKYVLEPIKIEVRQITEKELGNSPDMTLEMVKDEILRNPSTVWNKKWELLKPFARGERKGAFEQEAFLLQNEGDISSIIDTQDGKVIIQLVKRLPRVYKPLATVRKDIKTALAEKQFKKNFIRDLKSIIARDNIQAIEELIAQKSAKKEIAVGLIKNDTLLSQELFALKKGEYGVFMEGDVGIVVLLTAIAERNLPEFDSIEEIVVNDLHEERAYNAMIDTITQAQEACKDRSFEDVAKTFNASLHYTDMIKPSDNKKIQELDKKELPAKRMLSLDKQGSLIIHNGDRASLLIKLDAIEKDDQQANSSELKEVESLVVNNRMKMQVESVVASLHRNATIEMNESTQLADEEYSE